MKSSIRRLFLPAAALLPGLLLLLPTPLSATQTTRRLLCLGDSLTAGLGLDEDQAWPALLQARLDRDLPGWTVINAGASGDTSADALARLDWLLKDEPDAVFVCLGGNDGLRGLPPGLIRANLDAILKRLKGSGAKVVLSGMDLPSNLGPAYRAEFKALFPRAARAAGCTFMPFMLEGVAGVESLNQSDGMHPNAAGQALVAGHVGDFLIPRLRAITRRRPAGAGRVLRRRADLGAAP